MSCGQVHLVRKQGEVMGRITYIDRRTRTRERAALLTDTLEALTHAVDVLSLYDDQVVPTLESWRDKLVEILRPGDRRIISLARVNRGIT